MQIDSISVMGKVASGDSTDLKCEAHAKVHASMCKQLKTMLDSISDLVPEIESAQPGCKSGILELCSLICSVKKGDLLVEHCITSSKLYAVITWKATIARCERIQAAIIKSLNLIASSVREPLSSQIIRLHDTIRNIRFQIDPYEEEAGEMLRSLLCQTHADEDAEIMNFQIAASRLNLRSSKALLIETRCIKKLMKHYYSDVKKEKIINYLYYLLKRYGKSVLCATSECDQIFNEPDILDGEAEVPDAINEHSSLSESACDESVVEGRQTDIDAAIPEEFICPISRKLMYDPVFIASGQTYERMWIEKWFTEGHDTCPKTHQRLKTFRTVTNSPIKSLISQWCQSHGVKVQNPCSQSIPSIFHTWGMLTSGSISSLDNVSACLSDNGKMQHYKCHISDDINASVVSSVGATCPDLSHIRAFENSTDSCSPMFSWSDDYQKCQSFAEFSYDSYLKFLADLSELPFDSYKKALEDVKLLFSTDHHTLLLMLSNGFEEAIVSFLKDAYDSSNISAQKTGLQILEAFLSIDRFDSQSRSEITSFLLAQILDYELTSEALSLILTMCQFRDCIVIIVKSGICSSLIEVLKSGHTKYQGLALEILCRLSCHVEIQSLILSMGFLSTLVSLLRDGSLAGSCLKIFLELCSSGAGAAILKTSGCLASILELLDSGGPDEQADVVAVLYTLCCKSPEYSLMIAKKNVFPHLCDISVNGTPEGMNYSKTLLHLLRDALEHDRPDIPCCESQPPPRLLQQQNCLKKDMEMEKKISKSQALLGPKSFITICKSVFRK